MNFLEDLNEFFSFIFCSFQILVYIDTVDWRKKDNEKAEIFQKIEPYLTFLNIQQLKRQGADLETKIEELQDINQVLREKDKMKEDVIANLSDKLILLSERLDAVEKLNRN